MMPYTYFQLVRTIGMIGFALLAYHEKENNNNQMAIFYILSALIINPIFKVTLGRTLWNLIDVIWAIILLISLKRND